MEKGMNCLRMLLKASSKKCEGPFSAKWACSLELLMVITMYQECFHVLTNSSDIPSSRQAASPIMISLFYAE